MSSGVYKITNLENGKIYIGSSNEIERRWAEHKSQLKNGRHHSVHLQRAYDTYGSDTFCFEVIEECAPQDCELREQFWLDQFKPWSKKTGYNISKSASKTPMLGRKHTEESKRKVSLGKRRESCSEETLEKYRTANSGESNPHHGKPHSEESKQKISQANKGHRHTEDAKRRMSEAKKGRVPWNKGRTSTPEERVAKSGENHPMFGKKLTEETKRKMSEAHRKRPRKDPSDENI